MDKARGIVVRLGKLGDTSLIAHWVTREAGLLKTVAKGARTPRSTFAGKLDLFVDADLVWVPARRGDLHYLKEVEVRDFKTALRRTYAGTSLAAYFGQILERAVEPEHPIPELFDLLARALDYLKDHPPSRRVLGRYELRLAQLLGLGVGNGDAAAALEQACGGLPKTRRECLSLLKNSE